MDPERALAAFKSQRDTLVLLLQSNLFNIASKLYSKSIISRNALDEAINKIHIASDRTVSLLSVVEDKIRAEPHTFTDFLRILESEPTLKNQALELKQKYTGSCDSPKTNSASSSAILHYGEYLEWRYSTTKVSNDDKFPPTPSKKFINLSVVKHKYELRDLEQLRKHTLHGKVEEILEGKTKIEIDDILQNDDNGSPLSVVFIEGPPGIGKSTLAWELCRRWDRKQYDLAVLLRLREREVQQMESVADLFQHDSRKLQSAVADEVIDREGKGVLFILDGYDELPPGKRHKSKNLLNRLLTGHSLPKCTVVVTSRPSATLDLEQKCKPRIQKYVEVLGFTQECVTEYASSIFSSDPELLKKFLSYVSASNNPAINSLMYIPLNAAIVVMVYRRTQRMNFPIPKTLTQLYTCLCEILLQRHIKNKSSENDENTTVSTKFSDLPSPFLEQLHELSKVAYVTFKEHKIIFYLEDVPNMFVHFGLLDEVVSLNNGMEVSYNFLHLTIHEFLVAYYINNNNTSEDLKLYFDDARWNVVWKFVSGLTGFEYFKTAINNSKFVVRKNESVNVQLFLLQCLFEAQTDLDYTKTYDTDQIVVHCDLFNSSQLDRYALGYCIANTSSKVSWAVKFNEVSDQFFLSGLKSSHNLSGNIKYIKYKAMCSICLGSYPSRILQGIINVKVKNYLSHPSASREEDVLMPYYKHDATVLSNCIHQLSNLRTLSLMVHGRYVPDNLPQLYSIIAKSNVSVLILHCYNNDMYAYEDLLRIKTFLDSISTLIKPSSTKLCCLGIVIKNIKLMPLVELNCEHIKPFCDILFSPSCLQLLCLTLKNGILITGSLTMLETNTCLTSVHILCKPPSEYMVINKYLPMLTNVLVNNNTLKILSFGYVWYDHTSEEAHNFNNALASNQTLQRMILGVMLFDRSHKHIKDLKVDSRLIIVNYMTDEDYNDQQTEPSN